MISADNYPHEVTDIINRVLKLGSAKYSPGYWRRVRLSTHLHHAMTHLDQYYEGIGGEEDHLSHAMVRLIMAIIVRDSNRGKEKTIADTPIPD